MATRWYFARGLTALGIAAFSACARFGFEVTAARDGAAGDAWARSDAHGGADRAAPDGLDAVPNDRGPRGDAAAGGDGPTPGPALVATAGGGDQESGHAIAFDAAGDALIVGTFAGSARFGNSVLNSAGREEIFVAKLSSAGNWLWAARAGSAGSDWGMSIAVDGGGNSYIAGFCNDGAVFGAQTVSQPGGSGGFLAKLSPAGAWLWVVPFAGGSSYGVVADASGVIVAGGFSGTSNFGATQLSAAGGTDVFVAKASPSGAWTWAVRGGGSGYDYATAVAHDSTGDLFVSGSFVGQATFGAVPLNASGQGLEGFVARLASDGRWLWARGIGGAPTFAESVAVDRAGDALVAGGFAGVATFGASLKLTATGGQDGFVAKISGAGAWRWANALGGNASGTDDFTRGVAVDRGDNIWVAGSFAGTVNLSGTALNSAGDADVFIARYGPSGVHLWSRRGGGASRDAALGVAVAPDGRPWVVGEFGFQGATFDGQTLSSLGTRDLFVWRPAWP